MIDRSMITEIDPIMTRVVEAFLLLGLRNAGTPLLMASTPVSAAHPEENARSRRNANATPVSASYPGSGRSSKPALGAGGRVPIAARMLPQTAMPMMPIMNA